MQFSIITPAKNESKTLDRVKKQFQEIDAMFDYEIIICDDLSTDTTVDIAKTFASKVLIKPVDEKHTISAVRNRGGNAAQGRILFFLDSGVQIDDINGFVRTVLHIFESKKVVGATVNLAIYPDQALKKDKIWHNIFNRIIRFYNNVGWGAAVGKVHLVRASAFQKLGGYNEALAAGEDNEFFHRLVSVGKTVFIDDLTVYYSPRRYRERGYINTIRLWLLNIIYIKLFGRAYTKSWKRAYIKTKAA